MIKNKNSFLKRGKCRVCGTFFIKKTLVFKLFDKDFFGGALLFLIKILAVRNLVLKIEARLTSIILKPVVSTTGLPKYALPTSIIFTKHHIYTLDAVFL